ncbi:MAG: threonine ammonia-lyase, partial [Candidatus Binatia bacterium]|nr:threonine ammonia-lyase [Candidatus Binatia bacterium]
AEGAGAAALVPILKEHPRLRDKTVVAIISGGNIDLNTISTIITRGLARAGRYLHFCTHVPDTPGNLNKLVDEVSALKGNILDITHDRTFPELPLAHVKIDIILEIRNKEHGQAILKDIRSLGYSVRQVI